MELLPMLETRNTIFFKATLYRWWKPVFWLTSDAENEYSTLTLPCPVTALQVSNFYFWCITKLWGSNHSFQYWLTHECVQAHMQMWSEISKAAVLRSPALLALGQVALPCLILGAQNDICKTELWPHVREPEPVITAVSDTLNSCKLYVERKPPTW